MDTVYIDRKTKKREVEEIYGRWALSLLYGSTFASRVFSFLFLPLIAHVPLFSKFYGRLQKRKKSAEKIAPFIKTYKIDASEFQEKSFASFNDFFIRKLKPNVRPITDDVKRAALPADGRYLVFPDLRNVETFYVKGQQFNLEAFLQSPSYARRYSDGAMMIARLCPTDYHRFHFPTDGTPLQAVPIQGPLFSVNPIALTKRLSILWENKRMLTEIETPNFGTLLYVEVGATCVGSIRQTYRPNHPVKKGDEKGYFEFGGSCLVLLFERGRIEFDEDLAQNSKKGLETKAHFGDSLGKIP